MLSVYWYTFTMSNTRVAVVLSGAGGVTKTTTSVSVAMCSALAGYKTLLVDLDPRASSTSWAGSGIEFAGGVAALMSNNTQAGKIVELAQTSLWNSNLDILAGSRDLELREKNPDDDIELRLSMALNSSDWDHVVIDCPNRSGNVLLRSALIPAESVVYASDCTADGLEGVISAKESVDRFMQGQKMRGVSQEIRQAGAVVSKYHVGAVEWETEGIVVEQLKELVGLCGPILPFKPFVQKARMGGIWYGDYRKGFDLMEGYKKTMEGIFS